MRGKKMTEKKQAGYNKKMQKNDTRERQECPYHKKCGGCEYSGIPYEEQLQKKEKRVAKLLREFGKVEPIVGMSYPYYYRNKVHAVYAQKKNGEVICGTYEKDSHRVVDIESCLLENKGSTAASMSPSVSPSAFLQSIIPAPVSSRSSLTIAAVIAIVMSSK